jgi:hypothetical protein
VPPWQPPLPPQHVHPLAPPVRRRRCRGGSSISGSLRRKGRNEREENKHGGNITRGDIFRRFVIDSTFTPSVQIVHRHHDGIVIVAATLPALDYATPAVVSSVPCRGGCPNQRCLAPPVMMACDTPAHSSQRLHTGEANAPR